MKILLLCNNKKSFVLNFYINIFYFFRSVFLRGFINTLRLTSAEQINEKKYGIKTSSIKKSNSTIFFHYQGAGYLVLFKIFDKIAAQTKQFDFIDIGSGKGRPVFVAESYGYNNLTGIELDNELVKLANFNLTNYSLKRKESNIQFININALEFNFRDKPTVYFLFNPFNEAVLQKVLEKIISRTRSETWFVYMNPMYAKAFTKDKFEVVEELSTKRYLEAVIYKLKT